MTIGAAPLRRGAAPRLPLPRGAALSALFLALAACSPAQPLLSSTSSSATGTAVAQGASVPAGPRPLRGEPEGGSPRHADARWQQALRGDPLDLRALAQAEGASGLLEGVEDGGSIFRLACEALPFADDAEIALGRLAEIAELDDAEIALAAIVAIHRIASKPPSRGEPLDPDGVVAAARAAQRIASNVTLPRERRARAVSAARALAERGVLDPATIPADLDPAPSPSDAP